MAIKQTGRKTYKTMTGKVVDMDLLRQKNELTVAVGNAKVNARGDELGPGGKIIRTREQVMREHYENNPGTPVEDTVKRNAEANEETEVEDEEVVAEDVKSDDDWVEDDDGNFVKK